MANHVNSIMESLLNRTVIDSHTRILASECVQRFFKEILSQHEIDGIDDEDIEELAFDLVDELCSEGASHYENN